MGHTHRRGAVRDRLGGRGLLAVPADDARWAIGAALLATLIAVIDVAYGGVLILVGLLSAGPLVAALRSSARATAVVAVYCIFLAVITGIPNEIFASLDHLIRVAVVAIAGALAVRTAQVREIARRAGVASRNVVHSVFHSALDCIVSMDGEGRVIDLNKAAEQTFGYSRGQALGAQLCDLIIPERFREAHRAGLERLARGEAPRILGKRLELRALRADGSEFDVELTVTRASENPPIFTGFVRDIGERLAADRERERHARHAAFIAEAGVLLESSLDYEATLEHIARLAVPRIADWAFVELVEEDGSIKRVAMAHSDPTKEALIREYARRYPINPDAPEGSAKVIRTGRAELIREIPDEMLEVVAEDPEHLRILRSLGFRSAVVVPLRARGRVIGDLALVSAESGGLYDEDDLATVQELGARCALAIDNARLYKETRENEERLRHQSLHDPLTGLPNRTLFLDRLQHGLARTDRRPGDLALIFFDLDGFKAVNDTFGHRVGDELLAAIPARISGLLRGEDTIARFGGDEFAVLVEEVSSEGHAFAIAGRLVAALKTPFHLTCGNVRIGASLGIVFARGSDETPEALLRDADAAMYRVKQNGGGHYEVFGDEIALTRLEAFERDPKPRV